MDFKDYMTENVGDIDTDLLEDPTETGSPSLIPDGWDESIALKSYMSLRQSVPQKKISNNNKNFVSMNDRKSIQRIDFDDTKYNFESLADDIQVNEGKAGEVSFRKTSQMNRQDLNISSNSVFASPIKREVKSNYISSLKHTNSRSNQEQRNNNENFNSVFQERNVYKDKCEHLEKEIIDLEQKVVLSNNNELRTSSLNIIHNSARKWKLPFKVNNIILRYLDLKISSSFHNWYNKIQTFKLAIIKTKLFIKNLSNCLNRYRIKRIFRYFNKWVEIVKFLDIVDIHNALELRKSILTKRRLKSFYKMKSLFKIRKASKYLLNKVRLQLLKIAFHMLIQYSFQRKEKIQKRLFDLQNFYLLLLENSTRQNKFKVCWEKLKLATSSRLLFSNRINTMLIIFERKNTTKLFRSFYIWKQFVSLIGFNVVLTRNFLLRIMKTFCRSVIQLGFNKWKNNFNYKSLIVSKIRLFISRKILTKLKFYINKWYSNSNKITSLQYQYHISKIRKVVNLLLMIYPTQIISSRFKYWYNQTLYMRSVDNYKDQLSISYEKTRINQNIYEIELSNKKNLHQKYIQLNNNLKRNIFKFRINITIKVLTKYYLTVKYYVFLKWNKWNIDKNHLMKTNKIRSEYNNNILRYIIFICQKKNHYEVSRKVFMKWKRKCLQIKTIISIREERETLIISTYFSQWITKKQLLSSRRLKLYFIVNKFIRRRIRTYFLKYKNIINNLFKIESSCQIIFKRIKMYLIRRAFYICKSFVQRLISHSKAMRINSYSLLYNNTLKRNILSNWKFYHLKSRTSNIILNKLFTVYGLWFMRQNFKRWRCNSLSHFRFQSKCFRMMHIFDSHLKNTNNNFIFHAFVKWRFFLLTSDIWKFYMARYDNDKLVHSQTQEKFENKIILLNKEKDILQVVADNLVEKRLINKCFNSLKLTYIYNRRRLISLRNLLNIFVSFEKYRLFAKFIIWKNNIYWSRYFNDYRRKYEVISNSNLTEYYYFKWVNTIWTSNVVKKDFHNRVSCIVLKSKLKFMRLRFNKWKSRWNKSLLTYFVKWRKYNWSCKNMLLYLSGLVYNKSRNVITFSFLRWRIKTLKNNFSNITTCQKLTSFCKVLSNLRVRTFVKCIGRWKSYINNLDKLYIASITLQVTLKKIRNRLLSFYISKWYFVVKNGCIQDNTKIQTIKFLLEKKFIIESFTSKIFFLKWKQNIYFRMIKQNSLKNNFNIIRSYGKQRSLSKFWLTWITKQTIMPVIFTKKGTAIIRSVTQSNILISQLYNMNTYSSTLIDILFYALSFMDNYLPNFSAAIYFVSDKGDFNILSGVSNRCKSNIETVVVGEKLVGKCALLKSSLYIKDSKMKEDNTVVVAIPLIKDNNSVGVVQFTLKSVMIIEESLFHNSINSALNNMYNSDPIISGLLEVTNDVTVIISLTYLFNALTEIISQHRDKTSPSDSIDIKYIQLIDKFENSKNKYNQLKTKYSTLKNALELNKVSIIDMSERIEYLSNINNDLEISRNYNIKLSEEKDIIVNNLKLSIANVINENTKLKNDIQSMEKKIKKYKIHEEQLCKLKMNIDEIVESVF